MVAAAESWGCWGVTTPAIETVTTRNSVTAAADFDVWRPNAIRPVTRGIRDTTNFNLYIKA